MPGICPGPGRALAQRAMNQEELPARRVAYPGGFPLSSWPAGTTVGRPRAIASISSSPSSVLPPAFWTRDRREERGMDDAGERVLLELFPEVLELCSHVGEILSELVHLGLEGAEPVRLRRPA